MLKKCKKPDDVLFINAANQFVKGKRQNQLTQEHIDEIVRTYQHREQEKQYARRVEMQEIIDNDYNLDISRYVSLATPEEEIDLAKTHADLVAIGESIRTATAKHYEFLRQLGLPQLPSASSEPRN